MIQNILNDFYIIDKMKKDYYLMPIAIIPFGSGKNTLENRQKQARAEAKMQKAFTNALRAMQEVYKITYSFNDSSDLKTGDKHFDVLLKKFKLISSFEVLSYKVLVFVHNSDELTFVVRKKIPYISDDFKQLYVNWIKNKYNYITKKLKKILEFFYRTYKFNFYSVVTEKKYFNVQYDYSFFIVYSNAASEIKSNNYINAILDPTQVIYSYDEIRGIKNSIIDHRIQNIKTNNDTRYDIEKRSDYKVFFSWSTGLILGKFSLQEFFEYILIECDLQNKWNGINRLTNKYREKNNRLTLLTELNLAKLEIFKVNLNSLNDAGDSERILIIKDKIIQSSRIYNIIAELKNLLSLNQQLNSKYISLIAVGISFISLIIAIILS